MRLSVVVPFYGVEPWIGDCLASLAHQSLTDLEVLLVDDGSRDGSRAVAEAFAAADPRFRLLTQDNAGLGPARNTGMRQARGDYLAFVDSDDVVPRNAFASMVRRLDRSGSDFAAGNALRFNVLGTRESWLHAPIFTADRSRTTVREVPALATDRMVWNKVYRRSFWEAGGYEFPAIMYEDYPVTLRAYLEAEAVEVVRTPGYLWRERDAGETSITQRVHELANIEDRVASASMVLALVERPDVPAEVRRLVHDHLAGTDVGAVARALALAWTRDEADATGLLAAGRRLAGGLDPAVVTGRFPLDRVKLNLAAEGHLARLPRLLQVQERQWPAPAHETVRHGVRRTRLVTVDGVDLSVVPEAVRALRPEELALQAKVTSATWHGSVQRLGLEAWVELGGPVQVPTLRAWLARGEQRLDLTVVGDPSTEAASGPSHVHAEVMVDAYEVLRASGAGPATWVLHVELDPGVRGLLRRGPVTLLTPGSATSSPPAVLEPWCWVLSGKQGGAYVVRVLRPEVVLDAAGPGFGAELALAGRSRRPFAQEGTELRLSTRGRSASFPALVEPDGEGSRWSAHVPLGLVSDPDHVDPFVDETTEWFLSVAGPRRSEPVLAAPDLVDALLARGDREVQVLGDRFLTARVDELATTATVTSVDAGPEVVRLRGPWTWPAAGARALLRWHHGLDRPEEHALPLVVDAGGFLLEVPLSPLVRTVAEMLDLDPEARGPHSPAWQLFVEHEGRLAPLRVSHLVARRFPPPWRTARGEAELTYHRRFALRLDVRVGPTG